MDQLNPPGWKRPKGYSNGIAAEGRQVFVAGMVGWNHEETFESLDFVDQFRKALENTVLVLQEGGAGPEHICRMTMYFVNKNELQQRAVKSVIERSVKLIEINKGPDLGAKDKRDNLVKHSVVTDIFDIVGLVEKKQKNKFIRVM